MHALDALDALGALSALDALDALDARIGYIGHLGCIGCSPDTYESCTLSKVMLQVSTQRNCLRDLSSLGRPHQN